MLLLLFAIALSVFGKNDFCMKRVNSFDWGCLYTPSIFSRSFSSYN